MDKQKAAADIIEKALPLVPFDGWSETTLESAAKAAGYLGTDAVRVFPGGGVEAAQWFLRAQDAQMLKEFHALGGEAMNIRRRIAALVRIRLSGMAAHREAVRKAVALLALPHHAPPALKGLYATVDAIWRAAGDASTDFNFYTKRLLLAGVYSSTLLVWLNDRSEGSKETWAFLDRRIENVMSIEKAKQRVRGWVGRKRA
ncbi:MAG: COQ9 family protein [Pseudomonadota bacterium]|nr:COQ9 family protein [Pseudomonadota bacterium]MDE3037200.1 COQ9 family protein [Pseudomonadota bacterium]